VTASLFPELVAEAAMRITAAQRRAAQHVIDHREQYPTLEGLVDALCLAVLAAEDETARRVIVLRSTAGLFVYGPYASYATALKVAESGALGLGGTAAIVPLTTAPKSPRTKTEIAPPKRPTPGRVAA
jgi:hypothetical protein